MALLSFPGADRMLCAHREALPQPDQLCGPFSARVALHSILDAGQIPTIGELAAASGTAIWPHDVKQWRPTGAPMNRTGWDELQLASRIEASGTSAADLVDGVETTVGDRVSVVAVPSAGLTPDTLRGWLTALARSKQPLGLVANLATGPIAPPGMSWNVGHFVVLCALDLDRDEVLLADTYAELGGPGVPPGCRVVSLTTLLDALIAPPGRGLLLFVLTADLASARASVGVAGLGSQFAHPTSW